MFIQSNRLYKIFGVKPGNNKRTLYAECGYSESVVPLLDDARKEGYSDFMLHTCHLRRGEYVKIDECPIK